MAAPMEVMLSTDMTGMLWNACVWDFQSGTVLRNYKGGCSAPRSLCYLDGCFLMSAAVGKPIIHVWTAHKKEQQQRIICPGIVSCLATTANATMCAAGIAEKIHLWQGFYRAEGKMKNGQILPVSTLGLSTQTCSGDLLAVLSHHYQKITCMCFTDDGSHLVTGAEDNLVMVWCIASILQQSPSLKSQEPLHVWSKHALPITDVHCGAGGSRSRVISASQDQTCKLWDLTSGHLLCNFVFDAPVCSVTMDTVEYHLFAGCSDGNIYQVNLFESPVQTERHIQECKDTSDTGSPVFRGHSKPVTCLSVSMDGTLLVSGSQDHTACIWHINSGQCIRTLNHKGAVSNVAFIPSPVLDSRSAPNFPLQTFKRYLHSVESDEDVTTEGVIEVRIPHQEVSFSRDTVQECAQFKAAAQQVSESSKKFESPASQVSQQHLKRELEILTQTNQLLFKSAVEAASK